MAEPTPAPMLSPDGTPAISVSVGDRLRRRSRAPWIIAIAAVVAALLVAGGVWLWVAASPLSAPAIEVEEFDAAPEIGVWVADFPGAVIRPADVCEAGQDAALLILRDAVGVPSSVAFVSTATGEVSWQTSIPGVVADAGCAAASVDRGAAAITTVDANREPGLLSIDLAEGTVTRPPGILEFLLAPAGLDGDLIATTGTAVGRFDLVGLEPLWTLPSTGASIAAGAHVLIVDTEVVSLETGASVAWSAGAGAYGAVDGALLRVDRDGASAVVTAVEHLTGRDRWSIELGAGSAIPIPGSGLLLVTEPDGGTIRAIRVADGGEQWSIEAALDADPGAIVGTGAAGIALLPITGDPALLAVIDLASGERRFEVSIGDPAAPSSVIAVTTTTITVADPGGGRLVAIDAETGEERWAATTPDAGGTTAVVGGRFLLIRGGALVGIGSSER